MCRHDNANDAPAHASYHFAGAMIFIICLSGLVIGHVFGAVHLLRRSRGWIEKALIVIAMVSLAVALSLVLVRVFIVPIIRLCAKDCAV